MIPKNGLEIMNASLVRGINSSKGMGESDRVVRETGDNFVPCDRLFSKACTHGYIHT